MLIVAFALFVVIRFPVRFGFIPVLISLLIILPLPMFLVRGFYIGLLDVLLFRRSSVDLIVKENILKYSVLLW